MIYKHIKGGNTMKKRRVLAALMAAAMTFSLAACGGSSTSSDTAAASQAAAEAPAAESKADTPKADSASTVDWSTVNVWDLIDQQDLNFKIGIMSSSVSQGEENYRSAIRLQEKYGEDKVIVDTFPANAVAEQETTISKVMAIASDPDVKAIVFNQAQDGTIAAIKKLKEVRDDVLTVACNPNEDYDEMATVADVVLCKDQLGFADQVANLAVSMGAKNFVHYSFPRHMSNQNIAKRCERMKEICEENGINKEIPALQVPSSLFWKMSRVRLSLWARIRYSSLPILQCMSQSLNVYLKDTQCTVDSLIRLRSMVFRQH